MNLPTVLDWPMVRGFLLLADAANYKKNNNIELNSTQLLIVRRENGTKCRLVFNNDGTVETETL